MTVLRRRTADAHARIEACAPLARLFAPDYSLGEHARLLAALLAVYEPLEQEIHRGLPAGLRAALQQRKSAALQHDLQVLGARPDPRAEAIPALASVERKLGAIYVLEGASLGGRIIRRHLEARFGAARVAGLSFYEGDGARVGARWRSFLELMARHIDGRAADQEPVVTGALDTFACLQRHLDGLERRRSLPQQRARTP